MFTGDLQHAVLRWGRRIFTACGLMPPAPNPMEMHLPGAALGDSWVALGTSWGGLGRLFGAHGQLLAALGPLLGDFG